MDDRHDELVQYFIEETNKKFVKLEEKVDMLLQFKWQIISGSVVLSARITLGMQIAAIVFTK
jgi:hypothetical protein